MPDGRPVAPPSRRRILGSTTLGAVAGAITGLAAGVALALPPKAAPPPPSPGRRRFDGKVVAVTGAQIVIDGGKTANAG